VKKEKRRGGGIVRRDSLGEKKGQRVWKGLRASQTLAPEKGAQCLLSSEKALGGLRTSEKTRATRKNRTHTSLRHEKKGKIKGK